MTLWIQRNARVSFAHVCMNRLFTLIMLQGGMVSVIEDLGSISYNIWGKFKKSFGDISLSGRADVTNDATDTVNVNVAVEGQGGTMAQVFATAGIFFCIYCSTSNLVSD